MGQKKGVRGGERNKEGEREREKKRTREKDRERLREEQQTSQKCVNRNVCCDVQQKSCLALFLSFTSLSLFLEVSLSAFHSLLAFRK